MSSGSPGNTRAKRGKTRMKTPATRVQPRRKPFECGRCRGPVTALQRRATLAGGGGGHVKVCWRCANG